MSFRVIFAKQERFAPLKKSAKDIEAYRAYKDQVRADQAAAKGGGREQETPRELVFPGDAGVGGDTHDPTCLAGFLSQMR